MFPTQKIQKTSNRKNGLKNHFFNQVITKAFNQDTDINFDQCFKQSPSQQWKDITWKFEPPQTGPKGESSRWRWTSEMDLLFHEAICKLESQGIAVTANRIRQELGIPQLTTQQVSSRLQKYRRLLRQSKQDNNNQFNQNNNNNDDDDDNGDNNLHIHSQEETNDEKLQSTVKELKSNIDFYDFDSGYDDNIQQQSPSSDLVSSLSSSDDNTESFEYEDSFDSVNGISVLDDLIDSPQEILDMYQLYGFNQNTTNNIGNIGQLH